MIFFLLSMIIILKAQK